MTAIKEAPKGFFKQDLKVGDHVVMMLRSGTNYLRDCYIHSIEHEEQKRRIYNHANRAYEKDANGRDVIEHYFVPKVKISYDTEVRKWVYDYATGKGHYTDPVIKKRISRVYSWNTAITV